jgi:para-aminobenzoate synthetase/4-amino-4-deoxychorismate lyase
MRMAASPWVYGEPLAIVESPTSLRVLTGLRAATPLATFEDLERATAPSPTWRAMVLDYEFGARLEPNAVTTVAGAAGWVWTFDDCREWPRDAAPTVLAGMLDALPADERDAAIADVEIGCGEADYARCLQRISRLIADGDCYQINYGFPLHFRAIGHPLALYARLRQRQQAPHAACLITPQRRIVSLSPELLVERTGEALLCRPMKGTRARGQTDGEDSSLRAALQHSEKDRAENVMIVDLLRNDLGRIAEVGSVSVERLFEIQAYPTVYQMVSTIRARAPGKSVADVVRALFPCGSITGAPKLRAMQIIGELEGRPRGLYTGSLGCLAPNGDLALNVAIRSIELGADGTATMGVGSGVVADSEPASEYRECLLKANFLTAMAPAFRLIETMLLEEGRIARLDRHLQRLVRSAARLGMSLPDEPAVRADLAALAAHMASGRHRVRLTLGAAGDHSLAAEPLTSLPANLQAVLAAERVRSDDWGLRFKTTRRAMYDRALASLAGAPAVFDAIFLNERGELCEGARSNLFLQFGSELVTPAESCGLLPGVLRGELLETGRVVERVLCRDDLARADAVYMGNALRGLLSVEMLPDRIVSR